MTTLQRPCVKFIVMLLLLVPVLLTAQTKPAIKQEPVKYVAPTDGREMFRSYCGPCHGVSGKGDGPAAKALSPRPADLTEFAKRRNGVFSVKDFEDRVKGVNMLPAHGSTEMPIWGPVFQQLGNEPLRVANLRKYVESLQVK